MENGAARAFLPVAILAGCLLAARPASAQLVMGQYEDEAPLVSWNMFGVPSAPSLGLGGAQFARGWDGSASLANPALLGRLPRLTISLSASFSTASMFKYSLVNTGVVTSKGNLAAGVFGVDSGAAAFHFGKWAFGLSAAVPESYGRPPIVASSGSGGSSYRLALDQTGYLRIFHAGIARRLPAGLAIGLGLNWATGQLSRTTVEETVDAGRTVTITDDKDESYRGFFVNGGIAWEASERLSLGLVFRSAYIKRAKGLSALRYEVPEAGTDILIEAEATNAYRQPWVFGAGCSFRLLRALRLDADLAWFGWSGYNVTYFDEPLLRTFRDVVRAGAGVEYLAPARMYGKSVSIPFRIGLSYDPQPMSAPRSAYYALTLGTGLRLRALAVDISGYYGRETGSGDSLKTGKIVLTVRYGHEE